MNYYLRYPGDYIRDCSKLTLSQHGAYTLLLDCYYSESKPLPDKFLDLYKICRATTRFEKEAVRFVTEKFFPVAEDGLRHNYRADWEIQRALPKIEAARDNGKKGGRPAKLAPKHKPTGLSE